MLHQLYHRHNTISGRLLLPLSLARPIRLNTVAILYKPLDLLDRTSHVTLRSETVHVAKVTALMSRDTPRGLSEN